MAGRQKGSRDRTLRDVHDDIVACDRCPRLRAYCARVAREKRRAYVDDVYWGRPVPGFGDPKARLLLGGLAVAPRPAFAHGSVAALPNGVTLIGCYHPSRQNTNTGKLTPRMMNSVFRLARRCL